MIIRDYNEKDAAEVGLLIKETYGDFNLGYLSPDERAPFLGPFYYAGDGDPAHQQLIGEMIRSQFVYLAEVEGTIAGILRGRMNRLGSLFVAKAFHRQGVATGLVEHFEKTVRQKGGTVIRVASSLYAVPFYLKMGYKKSTGVRNSWSFDGYGFPIQPMRKVL